MDDELRDVLDCHIKYELGTGDNGPELIHDQMRQDRIDFIQEEFNELMEAFIKEDLPGAVDALVDMTYVIKGTAVLMGISPANWEDLWNAVHDANMKKIKSDRTDHHNGLTKPQGWEPPDIQGVLEGYKARYIR